MFSISKRPTIAEIHDLYKTGKATPSQVLQFFLNRSKSVDKQIAAFASYCEELSLETGEELDEILEQSKQSGDEMWFEKLLSQYPLFGIMYSLKAIILVEGEIFTAGSKILKGFKAPYSSTVYEKMKAGGGLLLGINHMDQFAMGSSGENSDYAITRNPFDTSRVPGGSSSGPIAAVASGQVVFSLGTDTGGSIRQPAAFCDVVGLKPTYGLVSRFGVIPMSSSLDQVGPITNNIEDNLWVTNILAGKDYNDQTSVDNSDILRNLKGLLENRKNTRNLKKLTQTTKPLKIGLPKEFYIEGIDPQIRQALEDLQEKLKDLGHTLVEVELPFIKYAVSVYYMIMSVEVAANLERIDGVRYAAQQSTYSNLFFEHRGKYFGDESKRRIMLGTYASSSGYYDAYYNKAMKVRELAKRNFEEVFKSVDILLTPTTPEFPFKVGSKTNDPLKMYLSDVFTCGINPVKIPGLNVPLGLFTVEDKSQEKVSISEVVVENPDSEVVLTEIIDDRQVTMLPTGCQLLAPEFQEDLLYRLGEEIEMLVKNAD